MSGENSNNSKYAGVAKLKNEMNQMRQQQPQSSSSETTFANLEVPVPQQAQPVIDPKSNSVIQQLNPNTFAKVKNGLNKITNQPKKNQQLKKYKKKSRNMGPLLDNSHKRKKMKLKKEYSRF